MSILPVLNADFSFEDGTFINIIPFCKKRLQSNRCQKFYASLQNVNNGIYCCPYGLSVYIYRDEKLCITYFSLRIKDFYKKGTFKTSTSINNPVLLKQQCLALISNDIELRKISCETENTSSKKGSVDLSFHEIKNLNGRVLEYCDLLLQNQNYEKMSAQRASDVKSKILTIYVCSKMLDFRFALHNYEKNPGILTKGKLAQFKIYSKFDKMQKIFHNYQNKGVSVCLLDNNHRSFEGYSSFDMLPFLLIDNAVKYSPENETVKIRITDISDNETRVVIESIGPYCEPNEQDLIFEQGKRGLNAEKVNDGSGIGLFFCKKICEAHDIDISAKSTKEDMFTINRVEYSTFSVSLLFHNTFEK